MKQYLLKTHLVIAFIAMNLFLLSVVNAQNPTKEFEMESILVDACNFTSVEPNNEMLVFKTGPTPVNIANLSVSGQNGGGPWVANAWPTTTVAWAGLIQNASTATVTAALQSTITNGCGVLVEPPGGIIPKYASVLMVTSTTPSTTDNSFATLTDTLYIVYHNASYTVTTGHFKNSYCVGSALSTTPCTSTLTPTAASRGFILKDNVTGTSDTVMYDITLLTNSVTATPYGGNTAQNDGATVEYAWPGFPTPNYINGGCKAPFIPLSATAAPTNTTICNSGNVSLTGTAGGTYTSTVWSGGSGTFGNVNSLNTTYTPGVGESGTIVLTLTVNGKCAGAVATSTIAVNINAAPSPTISSSGGATLCSGASTTLSVSSTGTLSTTYSWSPSGATTNTISVSPSVGSNIYTVMATNSCGTLNSTYTVDVNPLPTISIASASVCPGVTAIITASGASTYTWNTSVVSNTLSASPANTTTYTATGTDVNGCVGVGTGTITIYNTPTVTVNSPATCIGGTVTLNATGASTYTWSTTENGNSISVNPSTSTDYTVTGTDANGCDNMAVASVTINPLPTITSNSAAICPGATATLTASGASTYTWNTSATGATITDNPAVNTDYTVTGTDINGCVNTTTTTVSVVNTLTVTATPGSATICNGSSTTINGGGASSYTWTPSSSLSSGNGTSVTASPTVMTTYTVVGSSGSCKDSTTFTVNVNALPNVTAASTSTTVCSGTSVTLTGSGAQTYTWSNGVTDGIAFTPSSTQTYTVNGTDANGCVNSATVTVAVTSLTVTATSSAPSVCIGSSATLTATGATNYTWSPSATLSSANGSTVAATPTSTVPVTYTVVGTAGTCSASATVSFSVNPAPVITATASVPSVCPGQTVTVNASGAFLYVWTGGVSNGVSFTPSSTQTYSVVGIDMNGCSSNMASVTVSVTPSPTITVSASQTICAGNSATLTANNALTYTWTGAQNGSSISVTPASGINIYTVQGTDANGCTSNIASTNVTVNPTSTISVTSFSVCPGATATLTASGATTYTWSPSTGLSTTTGSVVTATTASTTVYTVTGDDGSCPAIPGNATVTVNSSPVITVSPLQNICAGNAVTFTASGASTYTWIPGNSHSSSLTIVLGASASYTVSGTSSSGCIGNSAVTSVSVSPQPTVSFVPDSTGGQAPLAVNFSNTSIGTGSLSSYWNFGNGDTSTVMDPHETYNQSGSYGVLLIVTDANGCKDTAMTTIIVTDAPVVVIIPNVFTPNGDSINDIFSIRGVGITKINCKIYDRWGVFLYEWSDLNGGWDGKNVSNGKEVTDGTYYFILSYSDIKSQSYNRQGYLQLIR